jgi:hypothetical protein
LGVIDPIPEHGGKSVPPPPRQPAYPIDEKTGLDAYGVRWFRMAKALTAES